MIGVNVINKFLWDASNVLLEMLMLASNTKSILENIAITIYFSEYVSLDELYTR